MPVYDYRCECGDKIEVLVRGREPLTADEIPGQPHVCDTTGRLTRQLSAPNIGRSGGAGLGSSVGAERGGEAEMSCGSCGRAPNSCEWD